MVGWVLAVFRISPWYATVPGNSGSRSSRMQELQETSWNHKPTTARMTSWSPDEAGYDYAVYGMHLRSRIKLTLDQGPAEDSVAVELLPGDSAQFASVRAEVTFDDSDWIRLHETAD